MLRTELARTEVSLFHYKNCLGPHENLDSEHWKGCEKSFPAGVWFQPRMPKSTQKTYNGVRTPPDPRENPHWRSPWLWEFATCRKWTQGDSVQTSERFPSDIGAVWEGDGSLKVDTEQGNSIRKPKLKLALCLILFSLSIRSNERAVSWAAGLTLSMLKILGALKGPLTLRPVSEASICAQDALGKRFQGRTSF